MTPDFRVLVCGDRNWKDEKAIFDFLDFLDGVFTIAVIIHGGCRGADRMAGQWADDHDKPCEVYLPLWDQYGKAAGPIRNAEMLKEGKPDMVVAFHNNIDESRGTKDMVAKAKDADIPVVVLKVETP